MEKNLKGHMSSLCFCPTIVVVENILARPHPSQPFETLLSNLTSKYSSIVGCWPTLQQNLRQ